MKVLLKKDKVSGEIKEVLVFHNDDKAQSFLEEQEKISLIRENEIKVFRENMDKMFGLDKMALKYYQYKFKQNPLAQSKSILDLMVKLEQKMEAIEVLRPEKINYVWKMETPQMIE